VTRNIGIALLGAHPQERKHEGHEDREEHEDKETFVIFAAVVNFVVLG
jgi:hypothetical protein